MKEKLKNKFRSEILGESNYNSNKQKSTIILIIGLLFMILLVIIIRSNYSKINSNENVYKDNTQLEEKVTFKTLKELFEKYKDNYNYNISIIDNNTYVYYVGSVKDNVNTGKKTKDISNINYEIKSDGAINLDTNEVITNLYDNYLYYFFIPENVYNFISNLSPVEEEKDNEKVYKYNDTYNDLVITIKITTTKDDIKEINYTYNNLIYNVRLSK